MLKRRLTKNMVNLLGWKSNRKIVVIESDDWGMVRMASKEAYNWFLKKGYNVDQCPYNRNDTLEGNEDLERLFEVLSSVRDKNGSPAIFTANNVVANPDFKKISESEFRRYFYEPFPQTLKRYTGRDRVMDLYKEGMDQLLLRPQFHGREHLNVNRWMSALNAGNKVFLNAFEQEMFTVHENGNINGRRDYLDAFGMAYEKEWVAMPEIIQSGLDLFEELWGYRATSFIAPCYVWPRELEQKFSEFGIQYIQGTHVQREPLPGKKLKIRKKYHYQGQKNNLGQRYLVRNVFFEPTENEREDSVARALQEVATAFKYKKPAVISSHRVNYMGGIRPENRDRNLKLLEKLLKQVTKMYPDVEFMSSDHLGDLMKRVN